MEAKEWKGKDNRELSNTLLQKLLLCVYASSHGLFLTPLSAAEKSIARPSSGSQEQV